MGDLEQKLEKFKNEARSQLEAAGVSDIDDAELGELVGNLKLVIDNRDALYVAGSDPSELETVRRNFVVKKLKISDAEIGRVAIADVVDKMASSRMKNRAAFYYLVKRQLG